MARRNIDKRRQRNIQSDSNSTESETDWIRLWSFHSDSDIEPNSINQQHFDRIVLASNVHKNDLPICNCSFCKSHSKFKGFGVNLDLSLNGKIVPSLDDSWWNSSECAYQSAIPLSNSIQNDSYNVFRLIGRCSIDMKTTKAFQEAFQLAKVESVVSSQPQNAYKNFSEFRKTWNLRLSDGFCSLIHVRDAFIRHAMVDELEQIESLISLTDMNVSKWKKPFTVFLGTRDENTESTVVLFHVYMNRLSFELIADDSISHLISILTPNDSELHDTSSNTNQNFILPRDQFQKEYFTSSSNPRNSPFSIHSIIQNAESTGYQSELSNDLLLDGFNPEYKLFDYQIQSINWMRDQEHMRHSLPCGLNSYLWRSYRWMDSGAYFVSPFLGELRLESPPCITGGILSEEMGCGKTIEVIALILNSINAYNACAVTQRNAQPWPNLILLPDSLVEQWKDELNRIVTSDVIQVIDHNAIDHESIQRLRESHIVIVSFKYLMYGFGRKRKRKNSNFKSILNVTWYRVIIDECQYLKSYSSALTKSVAQLRCAHRWMCSGTPFPSNSIEDLRGQLQFLNIWPFSIVSDGFWELKIRTQWNNRDEHVIPLLSFLIKLIMFRHTKTQRRLCDNSPLFPFPECKVDYVGIVVTEVSSDRILYGLLEKLLIHAAKSVRVLEDASNANLFGFILKQFLQTLAKLCVHPKLMTLHNLDMVCRYARYIIRCANALQSDGYEFDDLSTNDYRKESIAEYSPEWILHELSNPAMIGGSTSGNWQTGRVHAIQTSDETKNLAEYERMSLSNLLNELKLRQLPHTFTKRQECIELLIDYDRQGRSVEVHESGFHALVKCIRAVSDNKTYDITCAICLCDIEHPVFTRCVHAFCRVCIQRAFQSEARDASNSAHVIKCSVCRKSVRFQDLLAVKSAATTAESPQQNGAECAVKCDGTKEKNLVLNELDCVITLDSSFVDHRDVTDDDRVVDELRAKFPAVDELVLVHHSFRGKHSWSRKFEVLLTDLETDLESSFAVFSQHASALNLLAQCLCQHLGFAAGKEYAFFSGRGATRGCFSHLNDGRSQYRVILGEIGQMAAGLNLVGANVVYFLEPCWRMADELQAVGRVHRIGQKKNIRCKVLFMRDTIEERLLALRQSIHCLMSSETLGFPTHRDDPLSDQLQFMNEESTFEQFTRTQQVLLLSRD
mmetsp:Transcript_10697/g.19310  ORF Transcript_10697/g.19310 Transcript_10697/m.19310 type:complete len:1185 (-) Transcript_10697:1237-4791(-)|eukprot:CAMPEP_0182444308 /NCGR_PEP_ID=MMETSP1172-20130603/2804_1 /TAXON_ID=708627 /ORGANISM="Timspurckia oligopyrenoides, Strain CCMP3278" /LENGTH=1184 /DNA_ID=CAMNT_0024639841 /DNA_START=193 /DNA_END=3747 /DNA_ORIENTATION=+